MKLIKSKVINISSDGSLNFFYNSFLNSKQLLVFEKDNKNFILNKKKVVKKIQSEYYSKYKKKYLI